MDQLLNILNRDKQPYFEQIALGDLLLEYNRILPLRIVSPIVHIKETTRFTGYYINPNKTIDIYGDDRVGINLNLFWKNLVIYDIYGRPRTFLEKSEEGYRPRVFFDVNDKTNVDRKLIIMPVAWSDIQPGDIRFVDEDNLAQVTVTHIANQADGLSINLVNAFAEIEEEFYSNDLIKDWGDWFYTIVRL